MGKAAQYAIGALEIAAGIAVFAFTGNAAAAIALVGAGLGTIAGAALAPKPDGVTPADPQQQSHIFKGTTVPQKVIYGAMRVAGPMYEIAASGNLTPTQITTANGIVQARSIAPTTNSDFLHVIIPLAGHEVESIGNVIINNELVSPGTGGTLTTEEQAQVDKYASWVRVKRHLGNDTIVPGAPPLQLVDSDLRDEVPEWTIAHGGTEIAYIYLRLKYNRDLYPQGIRNIQADVLGKKVFDPRSGNTAWSDNWALCIRDYMVSSYGLSMADSEVDDTYITAAANISDEVIPTANGGSQKRYTLNGTLDLSKNPTTLLKSMLTAGMGHLIPSVEGKARLIPGAYSTPTLTVTESDLRGNISYQPAVGSKSKVNTIIGQYKGPDSSWVQVSFPQVGVAAYVTADGGLIKREIKLPFCTDHERCQRIARMQLEWERKGGILSLPCKITMLEAATMEVVMVTLPELGFVNKTFRVMKWNLTKDLGVDLILKEDAASVYAWQQSDATAFTPIPASLPALATGTLNPIIPGRVNGLELFNQGNNTVFTGVDAHLVWRHITQADYQAIGSEIFGANSGSLDTWFAGYEVEISVSGQVVRTEVVQDNAYFYTYEKNRLDTGGPARSFTVSVRVLGKQNQRSQPTIISVSNPSPSVPSPLTVTPTLKGLIVEYTAPADSDFAGVLVYLSQTSGFTPGTTTLKYDGGDTYIALSNLTPAAIYYVRVAAYDVFSKAGLNMSGEFTTTILRLANADITPGSIDNISLDPALKVDQIPFIQQNISSVSTTADNNSTSVTQHSSSINGIEAQYAVRLDVNGNVSGFGLISQGANGASSTFTILADKFQIVDPNDPNNKVVPVSIDAQGNAHFGGVLDAAAGSFAGSLTAATGSFSGAITAGAGSVIDGAHIIKATIDVLKIANGAISSSVAGSFGPIKDISPTFPSVPSNPVYPSNVAVGDTWDVAARPAGILYVGWYVATSAVTGISSAANWSYVGAYAQIADTPIINNPEYGTNHLFYVSFNYKILGSAPNDLSTLSSFIYQVQARKVTSWGAFRPWVEVYNYLGYDVPAWSLLQGGEIASSYTSNEDTQFRLSMSATGIPNGQASASSFATVVVR